MRVVAVQCRELLSHRDSQCAPVLSRAHLSFDQTRYWRWHFRTFWFKFVGFPRESLCNLPRHQDMIMGVHMGGCIHTQSIDQSPLSPHARFSLQQCSHCSQTVLLRVRSTHRHTVHRPHTSTHLSFTSPNPIKLGPHRSHLLSHPLTPHSHTLNLNFPLPTSLFPAFISFLLTFEIDYSRLLSSWVFLDVLADHSQD